MIIIGEKINSTLKAIRPAVESHDSGVIAATAKAQESAGAEFIDINAGVFKDSEAEHLAWLAQVVNGSCSARLAIDSPNPLAMRAALEANCVKKPLLNSITNETARFNAVMPLVREFDTAVVALTMDDSGMPETTKGRVDIAFTLIKRLTDCGMALGDIFVDPLIRPVGTGSHYGRIAFDTIAAITAEYPDVHVVGGLSNISFGLPERRLLNAAFLAAAVSYGLDSAILDPLDAQLMRFMYAAEALSGADDYCMEYISAYREGLLE